MRDKLRAATKYGHQALSLTANIHARSVCTRLNCELPGAETVRPRINAYAHLGQARGRRGDAVCKCPERSVVCIASSQMQRRTNSAEYVSSLVGDLRSEPTMDQFPASSTALEGGNMGLCMGDSYRRYLCYWPLAAGQNAGKAAAAQRPLPARQTASPARSHPRPSSLAFLARTPKRRHHALAHNTLSLLCLPRGRSPKPEARQMPARLRPSPLADSLTEPDPRPIAAPC